jgi:hypothetical protein
MTPFSATDFSFWLNCDAKLAWLDVLKMPILNALAPDVRTRKFIDSASGEIYPYQRRSMRAPTEARAPVVFFNIVKLCGCEDLVHGL